MFTFKAESECVMAVVSKEHIFSLEKKFYQIRDQLMGIRVQIIKGTVNEFDFYRYLPPRGAYDAHTKKMIKRKFKAALGYFISKVKAGNSKEVNTIENLRNLIKERQEKELEIELIRKTAGIRKDATEVMGSTMIPIQGALEKPMKPISKESPFMLKLLKNKEALLEQKKAADQTNEAIDQQISQLPFA